MKRHTKRPLGTPVVYTAAEQICPTCGKSLPLSQNLSRKVEGLNEAFLLVRRDRQCGRSCPGERPIFHALRDLRVVLPQRIYGMDVTMYVGERHLTGGEALAQIARDLHHRGVPVDQRHTGRIFRDFLALAALERGDDDALQAKLRAQGGIVLMCDGVQFDNRSPVLYILWDARSGTPLFGERKPFRGKDDLLPLLERVLAIDVPILGVVTDKETGLVPAVRQVFPDVPYQFCHTHFLKNCARPLQPDLQDLQSSIRRRADGVRKLLKQLPPPAKQPLSHSKSSVPPEIKASTQSCEHAEKSDPASGLMPMTEEALVREICALVNVNSKVSGSMPLSPAELNRHERLSRIHELVRELKNRTPSGEVTRSSLLEKLDIVLTLTWHEARTAGRVRRHIKIIRGLAHKLSTAIDRPDRPKDAAEAKASFESYLERLSSGPRAGLAAATGHFVDDLISRAGRYKDHLFHCFEDSRIPANTNSLERFFGLSKQTLRHALGCGSTSNSVLSNLGAEPLLAFQQMRQSDANQPLTSGSHSFDDFHIARQKIDDLEAPAIQRRSMVRHLNTHLHNLRSRGVKYLGAEPYA